MNLNYCLILDLNDYLNHNLSTCSNSGYIKKNKNALPCFILVTSKCYGLKKYTSKSELIIRQDKHLLAPPLTCSINNSYAWLSGFTDAEGFFYIIIAGQTCAFKFQINLHKDDINVLYFIQKILGFGEVRSYNNYASFTVTRLKDIAKIIDIFYQYPLQGTKWLNFRDLASRALCALRCIVAACSAGGTTLKLIIFTLILLKISG